MREEMMSELRAIVRQFATWWQEFRCPHDYVAEHYGHSCAIERCKKCGHIIQHGR